ncbi:MAG TPA: HypC/HybG/HupF family hydrogenase formation chaperone [Terracidiphilus sp.]|nr:HypC/HybG/HupF family hydrogenase formation chaperone [Terracidiphilus sp.]
MCLAIPGKIVEIVPGLSATGIAEVAGVRRRVQLDLLEDDMAKVGDWVLIHVGFAMSKISAQDAEEQMRLLSLLGQTDQAMEEVRGYGIEDRTDDAAQRTQSLLPGEGEPKARPETGG